MEIEKVGEIGKVTKIEKIGKVRKIKNREGKKNSKNRKVGEILKVWGNREGRSYKERVGKLGSVTPLYKYRYNSNKL